MMNVLFETRPMLALCFLEIFYKVVLASKTKRSDTIANFTMGADLLSSSLIKEKNVFFQTAMSRGLSD